MIQKANSRPARPKSVAARNSEALRHTGLRNHTTPSNATSAQTASAAIIGSQMAGAATAAMRRTAMPIGRSFMAEEREPREAPRLEVTLSGARYRHHRRQASLPVAHNRDRDDRRGGAS